MWAILELKSVLSPANEILPLENPSLLGCPGKTRDKLAGSRFESGGGGGGRLSPKERTRKQRVKFTKFRAAGSQRMEHKKNQWIKCGVLSPDIKQKIQKPRVRNGGILKRGSPKAAGCWL